MPLDMMPFTFGLVAHTTAPTPNLWLAWTLDPVLLLGLAAIIGGYFYAIGPARRRWRLGEAPSRAQIAWFVAGWLTLLVALLSPLDTLGDEYLFSAHMIQHMLIAAVAPPMLLLGIPAWLAELPLRGQVMRTAARWLANPIVAFGAFQADIWLWHAPALYDLTLESAALHIIEHLTFLLLGIIYWLPILSPTPLIPRISRGFAILYLFVGCQPMVALGALLTFSSAPLYTPYVEAARVWGLSPLADQQLGGLIMWLPTNIPYLIALSAVFFVWVNERDRAERLAAGEFDTGFDSDAQQESNMRETPDAGAAVAPQAPPTTQAME